MRALATFADLAARAALCPTSRDPCRRVPARSCRRRSLGMRRQRSYAVSAIPTGPNHRSNNVRTQNMSHRCPKRPLGNRPGCGPRTRNPPGPSAVEIACGRHVLRNDGTGWSWASGRSWRLSSFWCSLGQRGAAAIRSPFTPARIVCRPLVRSRLRTARSSEAQPHRTRRRVCRRSVAAWNAHGDGSGLDLDLERLHLRSIPSVELIQDLAIQLRRRQPSPSGRWGTTARASPRRD
jgi:hypothetical protein